MNVMSLFAGIGGFDLAARWMGWESKVMVITSCNSIDNPCMSGPNVLSYSMKSILNIPAKSGIYIIENTQINQAYIGSSANMQKRCNAHRCLLNNGKHTNVKLQRSYQKYGSENFSFRVLEFAPEQELIAIEQRLVNQLNPYFNIRLVVEGNRGITLSSDTKQRMSLAKKGKPKSEAAAAALRQIQQNRIGKPVTGKVKESLKLGPQSLIGKPRSEETKEKIRLSKLGKRFNPITRKYE